MRHAGHYTAICCVFCCLNTVFTYRTGGFCWARLCIRSTTRYQNTTLMYFSRHIPYPSLLTFSIGIWLQFLYFQWLGKSRRKSAARVFDVLRNFPVRAINNTYSQVAIRICSFTNDKWFLFFSRLLQRSRREPIRNFDLSHLKIAVKKDNNNK